MLVGICQFTAKTYFNIMQFYLPLNDIEIISIISLFDHIFTSFHGFLKHGIQNILHLFLQQKSYNLQCSAVTYIGNYKMIHVMLNHLFCVLQ